MSLIALILRFVAPHSIVAIPISTNTFSTAIFDTRTIPETH